MTRFYHNTTGYFNIYFNGYENFKKGLETVENTSENYTQLLPVYKNEREDIINSISGDMDESIKKAVKMIKMHSITVKPERKQPKKGKHAYKMTEKEKEFYRKSEYNKWVDDAYLLMGKAHYYKGDYIGSLRSLHVILNKFRKEEIRFYAMYWIARSHSAQSNFNEAGNYLKLIIEDNTHPKDLNFDIDMAYADIFIKQKKYDKALEKLKYLAKQIKRKKKKARITYLTAQIYQKINKGDKAIKLFEEVIKMNPPYEMVFSAKINMAKSFINSSEGSEKIRKILTKMLKDEKNIDFQDQIYYVLAGIEYKENNKEQAINYYKKSVAKSVSNNNQKALSYLALADIYFDKRFYLPAGEYYDSTMSVLNKKYPDYDLISKKANNLKDLTDNLKLINYEDSIQRIATMDSAKRIAYIERIIKKLIADEKSALNSGNNRMYDQFNRGDYNQNQAKGKWYFYNPQAISIGKSEFQKIWGKRKLEDHWRRKNKQVISENDEEEETAKVDSGRVTDNKKVEYYLQDLPLTDSLIALSNERIAKAYFDAGVVYERKMEDYPEAEKSYKTLNKRFPENDLIIESYFNLYLLNFTKTKNKTEAEKYRNKILNEFPYSKYAKILSDPNYLNKLKENKKKIDDLYSDAYNAYKSKKYNEAISKTEEAFNVSDNNHLSAKLLYIKGMSKGNLGNYSDMKSILEKLVKKHPKDEITPNAQAVLDLIASGKYDPDYYLKGQDSTYFYTVVTENSKTADKIKYLLTTFNAVTFPKGKFKIILENLGENNKAIIIKPFKNELAASEYKNKLIAEGKYNDIPFSDYEHFIISQTNLQKLKKLPIIEKYMKFYKENYK
ncbi:MAG: tetratricopeptide repeat protein [Bacteroidales bacterium]|nr:tetratricopeptide repeat protein [Bacteroidales bacterium]